MNEEDFFWSGYCQGVAISDTSIANSFAWDALTEYDTWRPDNSLYSIIDSGSPSIMISSLYFESLITAIFERTPGARFTIVEEDGVVLTDCANDFPDIFFMFDNHWLQVAARDYIFAINDEQCMLNIFPADMAMNIIGAPLFVDYYMVHQPDVGRIRVAPHSTSNKYDIIESIAPTRRFLTFKQNMLKVDSTAFIISWFISLGLFFGIMEYWNRYLRPAWQQTLSEPIFLLQSVLFFAAAIITLVFLIQQIIYAALTGPIEPAEASAESTNSIPFVSYALVFMGFFAVARLAQKRN